MFRSYKWWFFLAILLFVGGLVLGLATASGTIGFLSQDVSALKNLAELLAPLPRPSVLAFIFLKNVSAVLVSFIFSPLFCLVPVLALVSNGWLLGAISATVIEQKSIIYLLAGLLPHGIFELPAFIIGEAVALSFGTAVMRALLKKEGRNQLIPNLKRSLRYLGLAFALFLPAAIIETYVTPVLLR